MVTDIIPVEIVEQKIYLVRNHKVMLDRDLAELYGVETRVLNQAVRRNISRFPEDFMLSLTREEIMNLSQIVISSGIKHAPSVFAIPVGIRNRNGRSLELPCEWFSVLIRMWNR